MAGHNHQRLNEESGAILRLTTLSPVRPDRLALLRRRLAFVAWAPGVGRPLLDLATIHCARWIVFGSLPYPDGSDRAWLLNWQYLLFAATYDGPQDAYLNTFADILPLRLSALFGDCFGFESNVENAPGAGGRVFPAYAFRDFVERNRLSEVASYDYISDNVRTIRQALAIERAVQRSDRLSGSALEGEQNEVDDLALGPPAAAPGFRGAVLGQFARVVRPNQTLNPLTIVAPVDRHFDPQRVRLSNLPDTYFASLVDLPRQMQQQLGQNHPDCLPTNPDGLPTRYLLYMTDYYGSAKDYIEKLRHQTDLAGMFKSCAGFPGTEGRQRFHEWIARHMLQTRYYFAGYPVRPVTELRRLLAIRGEMAAWTLGDLTRTTTAAR